MKFLTTDESTTWLNEHVNPNFAPNSPSFSFVIPKDSGARTGLANDIRRILNPTREALLFILEWGVWPSSENPSLFAEYRRYLGEARSLQETPGNVFNTDELQHLENLLCLPLYFCWSGIVADDKGQLLIKFDDDEILEVYAINETALQMAREGLSGFLDDKI